MVTGHTDAIPLCTISLDTCPVLLAHACNAVQPPRPPRSSCMPIAGSGASGCSRFAFSTPPALSFPSVACPPVPDPFALLYDVSSYLLGIDVCDVP